MTDWLRDTLRKQYFFFFDSHLKSCLVLLLRSHCPPRPDVLLASPSIGPAVCTASLRSPITASPARSVSPVRSLRLPSEAPFTVQTSPVHSSIEILPPPPRSSVATTTAPLTYASSLTERALRSQRRDAFACLTRRSCPIFFVTRTSS